MSKGALPNPAGSGVLTVVLLIIILMIAGQETLPEEITGFKHVIGGNNSDLNSFLGARPQIKLLDLLQ